MDLKNTKIVEKMELHGHNNETYKYSVEAKVNQNDDYTKIIDKSNNTIGGKNIISIARDTIKAKYLRLTITGGPNTTSIKIRDFRVYGRDTLVSSIILHNNLTKNTSFEITSKSGAIELNYSKIKNINTLHYLIYDLKGRLLLAKKINANRGAKITIQPSIGRGIYILHVKALNKSNENISEYKSNIVLIK